MEHLVFFAYCLVCATLFALLEIQIEGPHGWAGRLPTWRIKNRVTRALLGEKPLTGYHVFALAFVLALLHSAYVMDGQAFNLYTELRIWSFFVLFWTCEDFLWFVMNPDFGLRKFTPRYASWHASTWWWIAPRSYFLCVPIGIGLYVISYWGQRGGL